MWFHSKDKVSNFNNNIVNTDTFRSFKYKAKLLGNTVAQPNPNYANGILKNATISVPLKYLSNFWRLLEILLINCKVKLKLKWTKYCVFSAGGTENDVNDNDNANNIIFIIKDAKLYVPFVTKSARDDRKLPKLLSKGFERSIYWNANKTKSENENIFWNQTLLEQIDYSL